MTNARRAVVSTLCTTALIVAGSPAAAAAGPRLGTLLPVPAGATSVTAADVTPRGVIGGTATTPTGDLPLRWTAKGRTLQELTLPAGATTGSVTGLTDRGEAAGAITLDGVSRAARWSADGRTATTIGGALSRVTATGPAGPWGVFTAGTDPIGITGESDLVARSGTATPLRGTPELDSGYRRTVVSVTDDRTALVWVADGIGRGATAHPVLWQDGATVTLPVLNYASLGRACASRPLPDGSVVLSGYTNASGTPKFVLVRHVGGVPGTDIVLSEAGPSAPRHAGLTCSELTPDVLAPDGGFAGYVGDAQGRRAAFWDASDVVTEIPLAAGEASAAGVAAASGGRMVIQAEGTDGVQRLSSWHDGIRTPLRNPPGWSVSAVVELTEDGVLVANLRDQAGTVRPAVWRLS